ncbi:hypothetical protein OPV22_005150 [Ensete ventricosum]|uniref:Uncharacterized protein n=1 Tax=Ensete ventricosum TaxID=4639 RepID=A0AAV8RKD0_ENSVE|nr:hypothetical protein OPV22_005150 [Ensete ventricosum]
MEMGKFACAVLVAAASATAALAADAPAPGPASASFAVTPAVGAVIGASVLSFFAFYLHVAVAVVSGGRFGTVRTCAGPTVLGGGSTLDDPYRHARKPSLERARLPSVASFPAPQEAASGTGASLVAALILPALGYLSFFYSYNFDSSHLLSFQQILSSPSVPRSTVVDAAVHGQGHK